MGSSSEDTADAEREPKYFAFISYSHADHRHGLLGKRTWGDWLHKKLEGFRVPRALVNKPGRDGPVPKRIYPIFRDRDELPGASNLSDNINSALRRSRYLIVICSPRAAASRWVNKEIRYFKALGREDRVLCFVIDGTPNASERPESGQLECFPKAVRFKVGPDGVEGTERAEPIAADARHSHDGPKDSVLKLVAGVIGVNYDDLKQRDRTRKRRALFLQGLAAVLALWAGASWWLQPSYVSLEFHPAAPPKGLEMQVDGSVRAVGDRLSALRLPPGHHEFQFNAPGYKSLVIPVDLARGDHLSKIVQITHLKGTLVADSSPRGSTIDVDERHYGSPISELPIDTGSHHLRAWMDGHIEVGRDIRIEEDRVTTSQFWLEDGLAWQYSSPNLQGGLVILKGLGPGGTPVLVHNERGRVIFLSSVDGSVLSSLFTREGNSRTFKELDLGGDLGPVVVSAFDAERDGPDLMVIAAALPARCLWRWRGPPTGFAQPQSLAVEALPSASGVSDVAVAGRDGKVYILDGRTGGLRRVLTVSTQPLEASLVLVPWSNKGRTGILCLVQPGDPNQRPTAQLGMSAKAIDAQTGEVIWTGDMGPPQGIFVAGPVIGGTAHILRCTDTGWQAINVATGAVSASGPLPGRITDSPILDHLEGNESSDILFRFLDSSLPILGVRVADGKVVWRGPSRLKIRMLPRNLQNGLLRTAKGEILALLDDAVVALDPKGDRISWSFSGNPRGILLGEHAAYGGDGEIYVTLVGRGIVCLDESGRLRWSAPLAKDVDPWALLPDDGLGTPRNLLIHLHASLIGLMHRPEMIWGADATGPLQSTPLVGKGPDGKPLVVQVGSWGDDRSLAGFNGTDGNTRWTVPIWIATDHAASLADIDGDGTSSVVVVGHPLGVGRMCLCVCRTSDGKLVRSPPINLDTFVSCTPAVADFRGIGRSDVAFSTWDDHSIILVDGRSGATLWRYLTNGPGSVAVPSPGDKPDPRGGPNMGAAVAYDLEGTGRPAVLAPSGDGYLYALRGRDGSRIWQAPIGSGGSQGMPVVARLDDGGGPRVLLVSLMARLYVIDGRSGQVLWTPEVASRGPAASDAETPDAMNNGTGRVGGHPAVLRLDGRTLILAPLGPAGVVAFDWKTRSEVWRSPEGFPVIASPVCVDWAHDGRNQVVVAASTGDVFVLDSANGRPLWHKRIGDRTNGSETFIEGDPVVADVDGDGVPDILVAGLDFHLYALNGLGPLGSLPRK